MPDPRRAGGHQKGEAHVTRWAYMIPAMADPNQGLLDSIRGHPTNALPDVVPVWAWFRPWDGHFAVDWSLLARLRMEGMEPILYAQIDVDPEDILDGKYDDALRLMAARSRGCYIRIFHEPNGGGTFPWQRWPVSTMILVERHVATLFHEEGAKYLYCVSHRGKANDDMLDRYPGSEYVDMVGFDEFRRSDTERLPSQQWAWAIQRLASTGKPVAVCETGAEASTTKRGRFMADLGNVQGLWYCGIFDYRIEYQKQDGTKVVDDWRWNAPMVREWDALPR